MPPPTAAAASTTTASAAAGEKHKYNFCCGLFNRSFRMAGFTPSAEVREIFNKYAQSNTIGAAQLQQFLQDFQGEICGSTKEAEDIIAAQHRESRFPVLHRHGFSLDTFLQFLLNPRLNSAINTQMHQDMTKPLSHYYIFTGHNSYLTGNQLSSDCSEQPIIKALRRGVRVVELDLWPDSEETNIEVKHGNTLTTPVDFSKCIRAIKQHAFDTSEYPVVVTLEDHLTPALQAKVAEIITTTLGDTLYVPPANETIKEFLSPEALKRRILISTKPPKEYLAAKEATASKESSPTGKKGVWGDDIPDYDEQLDKNTDKTAQDADDDDDDDNDNDIKKPAPEYKHIIAIRQKKKPKDMSLREVLAGEEEAVKRISLSEAQLEKIAKNHPEVIINFTCRNIMRIFPYGLRINSSNYNPFVAWSHGAQMVALNMQGYGRPLWIVHGFFKGNGACGYVKKPDFLLQGANGAPASSPQSLVEVKTTLKVKVLMGVGWLEKFGKRHFDNFSPPDFYVKVAISGVKSDQKKMKTKKIEDDWHPKWDEEFSFPLRVPELAVLRVEVHEYDMSDKDDFGGQVCIPVSELKTGLRCVTLCDVKGDELTGVRLLLAFSKF